MRKMRILFVILTVSLFVFLVALSAAPPDPTEVTFQRTPNGLELLPLGGPHPATKISYENGDEVKWRGVGLDIKKYGVCIAGVTNGAPGSPFKSGASCWRTSTGKISTGPASEEAIGHIYKYTITTPDGLKIDPHIYVGR